MKPLHKLRPALRRLAQCLNDRKGSIFVVVGAALPVLIGVLGLGADAGIWYANKRAAQTQTDAAAISGAFERARFKPDNVVSYAQKEAVRNGYKNTAPNTLTINNPPKSGSLTGNIKAVEVIMTTQQPLLFAQFFMDNVAIKTRAVASVQTTGTACVLALDPTANSALFISGNITVNMPGCVMAANSTTSNAIDITGGPVITADSLWTAGNYTQGGASSMTLTRPPTIQAWPIDDPYANLPPITPGVCKSWNSSKHTISPATYCGSLNIPGGGFLLDFDPGVYYIKNGDIKFNNNGVVRCTKCVNGLGVTIILTGDTPGTIGTVNINGNADIQLQAPTDPNNPYVGVLFYQDPRALSSGANAVFNGGPTMNLQGAVYFPKTKVMWKGNNSPSAAGCTQVIGRTVEFNGNATINNAGCEAAGVKPVTISGVRVVE